MPEKETLLRDLAGAEGLFGLALLVVGRFNTPSVFPGMLLRGLLPTLCAFGLPGLYSPLPTIGLLGLGLTGLIVLTSLGLAGRGLLALGLISLGLEARSAEGLGLACLKVLVPVRFPLVRTTLGLPVRLYRGLGLTGLGLGLKALGFGALRGLVGETGLGLTAIDRLLVPLLCLAMVSGGNLMPSPVTSERREGRS